MKRKNLVNISSASQHENSKQPKEPAARELEVQLPIELEGEHGSQPPVAARTQHLEEKVRD